ncbi:GNAT family N-acetyltransferase [Nocardia sp. NPDC052112]|uniref:GNAT family N-acetyltransferase n=1 Tax=Nocardia sp. NPDC052112 TaxID=3155646 RepID=UPI00344934D2
MPRLRFRLCRRHSRIVIDVRLAGSGDWQVWRKLRLEALADAPYAFASRLEDWQGDGDRAERWRARLSIPGSCNVIAALDRRAVGMVSGFPGPRDGVVELGTLWVSRAVRGQGVGDLLVQTVAHWAVQLRASVLLLTVASDNEHAVALYRRNGFDDARWSGGPRVAGRPQRMMTKALRPSRVETRTPALVSTSRENASPATPRRVRRQPFPPGSE